MTQALRITIPVVRITVAPAPGLDDLRGRPVHSHADAAAVLAPFLGARHASTRLAVAVTDRRNQLRAVALFDGVTDSACCLLPSDLAEALIVTGAQRAWLGHRHRSRQLHVVRQDLDSIERARRLVAPLGLTVPDHLIVGATRYASLVEASAQHAVWWKLRRRVPAVPPDQHPFTPARSRATRARAPRSRHVAFTLAGLRTLRHDFEPLRVRHRPQIDTPDDAAALLEPFLQQSTWAAALLDRNSRLIAVARIDSTRGRACVIDAANVYRAAITLGAARVVLAHRHSSRRAWPTDDDLRTTQAVYTMGFALGRELRDVLVFARNQDHVSLRALGAAVPHWQEALDTRNPNRPAEHLRWHQIQMNRRPTACHTRHAEAARAALWRCTQCQRRQNYKHTCRYCGAPRDASETTPPPPTRKRGPRASQGE